MQSSIDPAPLLDLKISHEEFVQAPGPWRQRIQFEPLDDNQPASQAAYTETRNRGLTWAESVRETFTWELPGGTVQIESRDKGRRFGWLDGQMLFEARFTWKLQLELTIGSEKLLCGIGVRPYPVILPDSQWCLIVQDTELLRGPMDFSRPGRLISHVNPGWAALAENQQIALLAFCLFNLLQGGFRTRTHDPG